MRRLAWKTSMLCVTLAGWTALIAALAPPARSADGWAWPVRGELITRYANDDANPYAGGMHRGIDIAAPVGTPVVAARSGEVTYAGELGYSGLTVSVRSGDGRHVASYLHLSAASVRRGETLAAGQRLGEIGTTGRRSATEPHLHFGVRLAGEADRYVDPLTLLPPLGGPVPPPSPVPVPAPVRAAPRLAAAVAPARAVPARRRARARGPAPRHGRAPAVAPRPIGVVTTPGQVRAPGRATAMHSSARVPARHHRQVSRGRLPASAPAPRVPLEAPATADGGGGMPLGLLGAGAALIALALGGAPTYRWLGGMRLPREYRRRGAVRA